MFEIQTRLPEAVRQGLILVTFLFNSAIDCALSRTLETEGLEIALDDMVVANLDFRDDIALLDDKPDDAEYHHDRVSKNKAYIGLEVNVDETVLLSLNCPESYCQQRKNRKKRTS